MASDSDSLRMASEMNDHYNLVQTKFNASNLFLPGSVLPNMGGFILPYHWTNPPPQVSWEMRSKRTWSSLQNDASHGYAFGLTEEWKLLLVNKRFCFNAFSLFRFGDRVTSILYENHIRFLFICMIAVKLFEH